MTGRTIAIGDIHGCSTALRSLLQAVDPGSNDLIVTLGDYVNRGPDSRGVLDQLIDLRRRSRLVSILGNHDEMLLQTRGGSTDLAPRPAGGLLTRAASEIDRPQIALTEGHFGFLEACDDYFETDDHIFLHASYDPVLPMNEQPTSLLRWQSLRRGVPGRHVSGKTVVAGHTSQKNGKILDLGHLRCIDTYCYGGGWLTALDVHSGEHWQVDVRGRARPRRSLH
ncbi:MAG: metallophosphoesterase family protein [Paludisphaera borealis]|uniref:metallophosphoesterase family protein n=1 Tax=Paludisphaera borealis TaxID=1387353 RepID=UPI0028497647|nr:metallophosphoesterase family protein [Paludisphaera borealis]MDR3618180.1 metallophosphoesterase family protein [Paludisphaera borealis]